MPILHRSWYSVYPKGEKPLPQHLNLVTPIELSMKWLLFTQTILLSPGFNRDQMRLKHSIIQSVLSEVKSAKDLTRLEQWQLLYCKYFRKRFNDLFDVYENKLSTPLLQNITTNPSYPAYKTQRNTIIQLNGPNTRLPSGKTLQSLIEFADDCGLDSVLITGGSERSNHSPNSFHGKNLAIDVAGKKFNPISHNDVIRAARKAGFTHAVYEDFKGHKKDHWHLQIGEGNGLNDQHVIIDKKSTMYIKSY